MPDDLAGLVFEVRQVDKKADEKAEFWCASCGKITVNLGEPNPGYIALQKALDDHFGHHERRHKLPVARIVGAAGARWRLRMLRAACIGLFIGSAIGGFVGTRGCVQATMHPERVAVSRLSVPEVYEMLLTCLEGSDVDPRVCIDAMATTSR